MLVRVGIPGAKREGLARRVGPDESGPGGVSETRTWTCSHCSGPFEVPHGSQLQDVGGRYCMRCDGALCRGCAPRPGCWPIVAEIEKQLAREALRHSMGLG